MKVAVVGTGYVGLVTGVVLADLGNDVVCVDSDPSKVERLSAGIPTIYEPGLEEILKRTLADGFLSVSGDTNAATLRSDVIFIAVGTPPAEDGTPDLTAVKAVAVAIGKAIASDPAQHRIVVNKSTVPVGSGDLVESIIIEQGAAPESFDVVSNPEFLREGTAIQDTLHPDRIVIGAKRREAALKLVELYAPLERQMLLTDLNSAELIKYASNSFLATKISFINAISRLCEACGGNIDDVAKGMGADRRIGHQFLQAGLGWGGSCFPKDVQGLLKISESLGYQFDLLESVVEINETQTAHFIERIRQRLGGFARKTIGLLGLAFKPNTDDIRDAKSLVLIEAIESEGGSVRAYDPVAGGAVKALYPGIELCSSPFGVGIGADALVLVTEWNEFRHIDFGRLGESMKSKLLFDGRRGYRREVVERAGFEYYVIGE